MALEAVGIASDLLRTRVPGLVTSKGDRDMATEVDFAVERVIRAHLQRRTPAIAVLGEEEGISGGDSADLVWAIDPVDGTANFARGLPLCGVSLGLLHRDRAVLGVIDLPFLGARYSAASGTGAHLGDRRIHTSATSDLADAIVALGDYAVGPDAAERNRLRFAVTEALASHAQRVRMLGSIAVDLAWLAEGKIDASITLSNNPWDTAAGSIIAREAGATITDHDGTPHTTASATTIATTPALSEALLNLLKEASSGFTAT
ncbi:inositol monophosphatase family protein [Actinocorallia lasiicapitis]